MMKLVPIQLRNAFAEKRQIYQTFEALQKNHPEAKDMNDLLDVYLGYNIRAPNNFSSNLRESTLNMANPDKSLVVMARQINNGDLIGAVKTGENDTLAAAPAEEQSYKDVSTVKENLELIKKIREELPLVDTSLMGKFDKYNLAFNQAVNIDGNQEISKANRLATDLTLLFQNYRHDQVGTAITETEAALIRPIIADMGDQPDTINDKISEMESYIMRDFNATRYSVNLPQLSVNQILDDAAHVKVYQDMVSSRANDKSFQTYAPTWSKYYSGDTEMASDVNNSRIIKLIQSTPASTTVTNIK